MTMISFHAAKYLEVTFNHVGVNKHLHFLHLPAMALTGSFNLLLLPQAAVLQRSVVRGLCLR